MYLLARSDVLNLKVTFLAYEAIDGKPAHHQGGRRDQSPPRLPSYFRTKVDIHEDFLQSMLAASKLQ